MIGISYFIIHLLALILPGLVIVRLLGLGSDSSRLVMILASSYIYYVLLAALSKWLNLPLNTFIAIYALLLAALAGLSLWIHAESEPRAGKRQWLIGLLIVICSYTLYRYLVGPYTEVPADLLRHLEFAGAQLNAINDGHLGTQLDFIALIKQQGGIWYSFYALITSLTGLEFDQTLPWAVLANALTFLCAVYGFTWYISGHFKLSNGNRLTAALLATFFTATHLGLNVFAYLRYYAIAPTMLNMVIYLAAVIAILELLRWRTMPVRHGLFLLICLIATTLVHRQEGLFILVMGGMMLAWFSLYSANRYPAPVVQLQHTPLMVYRITLLLFALSFFALVTWTYLNHDRPNDFFNKIIQLSERGPVFNRVLFLNPTYQGFQVITLWGVLVYALFVMFWRKFIGHPYLFTGMLIPLFTVFNPVFVDWFMRMDGVHTLWRMLYIVPLHFVAGLLFVFLLASASHATIIWRKGASYLAIAMLFILLLPLSGINTNSRLTLAKVEHNNSYVYWLDLIDYLNRSHAGSVSILTDPVTGYMLKGLTRHRTYHHKFFKRRLRPFNFEDYSDAPLAQYKGWLLVLNDRDGGPSQIGKLARHWPENILNTSKFYSESLREHIKSNPGNRFKEIWENNDIHVYRIQ